MLLTRLIFATTRLEGDLEAQPLRVRAFPFCASTAAGEDGLGFEAVPLLRAPWAWALWGNFHCDSVPFICCGYCAWNCSTVRFTVIIGISGRFWLLNGWGWIVG